MKSYAVKLTGLLALSLVTALAWPPPEPITVYLVGDSTLSEKEAEAYPETGWGMPFGSFFDSTVVVENHAKNGRSTRSFLEEGRWQPILDRLKPGDYVLIQFGHNDEVPSKRTYTPETEFKANLVKYVTETRSKQARPVLLTPVARRRFDEDGRVVGTHEVYSNLVRDVAEAHGVPLIDLDRKSQALLRQMGLDASKYLFNHLEPGEHPNYPEGVEDDTHFNEFGARKIASLVYVEFKALAFDPNAPGQEQDVPKAFIDGTAPGWIALGEADFVDVNGEPETWVWRDGLLVTTGEPIGVLRTREAFENFEMVVEWRHLQSGGNSGVFAWVPLEALEGLEPGNLPEYGIEIQMLDHGYTEQYEARTGEKAIWFTSHGDVFPVGESKLQPFAPTSPNGVRSFPREHRSRGVGEWNHYYVRAINGEVRLWVNGEEVSGGTGADPAEGYLCMEAEGAPVEFKNIRVRRLP